MIIDRQSLNDLNIFSNHDENTSVFGLLKNTRSRGGEYRLRERFMHPISDLEGIRKTQHAVRFLMHNSERFYLPASNNSLLIIENYLNSNISVSENISWLGNIVDTLNLFITDKSSFSYLQESIPAVANLVISFYNQFSQVSVDETLPEILQGYRNLVNRIYHYPGFLKLIQWVAEKKSVPFNRVIEFDRLLRHNLLVEIKRLLDSCYDYDSLLSMAASSLKHNFVFPEFHENQSEIKLEFSGLYHIFLSKPVSYTLKVPDTENLLFITGPNMAGKTTFLKTIGVSVLLAHCGMGVPANHMALSRFDRLITSLTVSESLQKGYSYFLSEVKRVKEVATCLNSGEKVLALFDELFKGTNVKDSFDASVLIINGLINWNKSLFILSTHLAEVGSEIAEYKNVGFYCFNSALINGTPEFDYRLMKGISNSRLGLHIINNEGIPELLMINNSDTDG